MRAQSSPTPCTVRGAARVKKRRMISNSFRLGVEIA
jgi:hypothetical protein